MKYLLDTHVIIWHFEDSPKLSQKAVKAIYNPDNDVFISSISLWEIAIKINTGKLNLAFAFDELLSEIKDNNFGVLQIKDEYLRKLSVLPYIHKDPFDRLLISTTLNENVTIITADENIQKYDVSWIW
ncbi:MAG: type II toxin-antitoxin system VapC family toxin [Oscillospiraceae bacterium]|nr:type II toxin-antitoxin system VapC family toxin [Oscillospiraceae bacterium]